MGCIRIIYTHNIYMNSSLLFLAFLYLIPSSWSNLNSMNLDISISCFSFKLHLFFFNVNVSFRSKTTIYCYFYNVLLKFIKPKSPRFFFRFGFWFIILVFVLNYSLESTIWNTDNIYCLFRESVIRKPRPWLTLFFINN